MPPKRMTANPTRPARYRPGKALAPEEESGSEEEDEGPSNATPPPQASSFPSSNATKLSANLSKVDLNERRRQAAAREAERLEAQRAERAHVEEGFVTEESEESEGASSSDQNEGEEGSSEEETSSEDEAPRKVLRPVFVRKDQRNALPTAPQKSEEQLEAEEEAQRKAKADELLQEQLEQRNALKAAGRRAWDDDEEGVAEEVDDTDGLDPEAERAAWKIRELQRIARARAAIEEAEKEREEIERRRNMTTPEREAADREKVDAQKAEKESRGNAEYLQKYHHKGAFFMDDETARELAKRDIMGSKYQDQTDRAVLPKALQMRDMTKIGKKGAKKYRDLMSEDTGRFGVEWGSKGRGAHRGDDRFRPDDDRFKPDRAPGPSGANASAVGDRKRSADAANALQAKRDGPRDSKRMRHED